ncbi:MAG: hypothetical protein ABSB91_00270 [Sedimentisphaerales bacterium]
MKKILILVAMVLMLFVCRAQAAYDKTGFQTSEARKAISEDITGLEYDSRLGIFRLTSGYFIPTDANTKQSQLTNITDVNVRDINARNIDACDVNIKGTLIGVTAANLRTLLGEVRGATGALTGDKVITHGLGADPNVIAQTPDPNVKIKVIAHDATTFTLRPLDVNDINIAATNASWIAWK